MMRKLASLALLTGALLMVNAARAAVIFDGFGPGDSFELPRIVSSADDDVGIPGNTSTDRDWALAFTVSGSDFTLDSIEIALSLVSGANEVDIYLRTSTSGLPDALLESWHLSNLLSNLGQIFTLTSALSPLLSDGNQYWIEMSAGTANVGPSKTGWQSSTGNASPRAEQFDEGVWLASGTSSYAYRVNGIAAAVPAPATLVLLVTGLITMARRWHRA